MKALKFLNLVIVLALALSLAPAWQIARAQDGGGDEPSLPADAYVPGEMIVRLEDGLTQTALKAKASALAGQVGAQVAALNGNAALLSFDPDADLQAMIGVVGAQVGVKYAQPNYVYSIPEGAEMRGAPRAFTSLEVKLAGRDGQQAEQSAALSREELLGMRSLRKTGTRIASVPTFARDLSNNWGNEAINLWLVWPNTAASPTVCVLDTGVDGEHPDLKGRVINGYDFANGDALANDDNGHGTHVAGIIAARPNNDEDSTLGVSSGKVLAVKVLNYLGNGSSWDVGMGIRYCANSTAKVLNMSLGSYYGGDTYEYEALSYAINTKKKLVVAAAGNGTTSNPFYPAAWAHDLTPTPLPVSIASGLVSVGAARYHGDQIWVDVNGDSIADGNEHYSDCATDFSNYGRWVSMVAPGEDIFSTTPTSYPFQTGWDYDLDPGYNYFSGTSMAAPHVAGAAARLWSINAIKNNAWIKDRLIATGIPLWLAVNPGASNPTIGYHATFSGEAPFCWPRSSAPYGALQDMSNARYLDLAAAMDRGALAIHLVDAATGLPLTGATVRAVDSAGVVKDTARLDSTEVAMITLINMPANSLYKIQVNKAGYTRGYQTIMSNTNLWPGTVIFWSDAEVGIPSNTNFRAVLNWINWFGDYDLDLHLWITAIDQAVYWNNPGSLWVPPYALLQNDSDGSSYVATETIAVRNKALTPWYSFPYSFYVQSYPPSAESLNSSYPVVRIWYNGVIKQTWYKDVSCGATTWEAGSFYKSGTTTKYSETDDCW